MPTEDSNILKDRVDRLYEKLASYPSPFTEDYKKAEAQFQQALAEYKGIAHDYEQVRSSANGK